MTGMIKHRIICFVEYVLFGTTFFLITVLASSLVGRLLTQ